MGAAVLDVEIIRGDNDPAIVWQLVDDAGNPFMEESSTFVLAVSWLGGSLTRDSAVDASLHYDSENAKVTWTPSPTETAMLPLGRLARYSLQRRTNDQHRTFVQGLITASGVPVL